MSVIQHAYPKVAQPKPGAFQLQFCHCSFLEPHSSHKGLLILLGWWGGGSYHNDRKRLGYYGGFLQHLDLDIRKISWRLERLQLKISKKKFAIFDWTCLYIYIYIYHFVIYSHADSYRKNHNDMIIKTREDFFKNIPLTLLQGLRLIGSWRPNRTAIYWPPILWPSALCLSRSPDAQPEARGPTQLAFSTASYHQLV